MVLVGFLPLMVRMVRTENGDSSLFLTDFSRTASKIPCLTQSVLAVSCLLVLRVTTQRQRSLLALDPFRYWCLTSIEAAPWAFQYEEHIPNSRMLIGNRFGTFMILSLRMSGVTVPWSHTWDRRNGERCG